MQKPTDYPLSPDPQSKQRNDQPSDQPTDNVQSTPSDITYAEIRDRVNAEQPVTEEMIKIARTKLETAHTSEAPAERSSGKFKLPGLPGRFR